MRIAQKKADAHSAPYPAPSINPQITHPQIQPKCNSSTAGVLHLATLAMEDMYAKPMNNIWGSAVLVGTGFHPKLMRNSLSCLSLTGFSFLAGSPMRKA